ncbi:MAG: NAD(P)H-dependent oxidoreductase [Pseudomonadota bacterium]
MPSDVLLLFAHPRPDLSACNVSLFEAAADVDVTRVDLYGEYPRHDINVDLEQQRLRDHHTIVLQFPVYWYSTPPLMKEWIDLVLEYGFAYGVGGDALAGKRLVCAVTTGAQANAYSAEGIHGHSLRELLRPLERTAVLCQMTYVPPFALFGAQRAAAEGVFDTHTANWRRLLHRLKDPTPLSDAVLAADTLNTDGQLMIEEGA